MSSKSILIILSYTVPKLVRISDTVHKLNAKYIVLWRIQHILACHMMNVIIYLMTKLEIMLLKQTISAFTHR